MISLPLDVMVLAESAAWCSACNAGQPTCSLATGAASGNEDPGKERDSLPLPGAGSLVGLGGSNLRGIPMKPQGGHMACHQSFAQSPFSFWCWGALLLLPLLSHQ